MQGKASVTLCKLFLLLSVTSMTAANGARILFYLGTVASKSHRSMFDPLSEELAKRGHEIVVASMYPSISKRNVANIREIGHEMDILKGLGSTFNTDTSEMTKRMFLNFTRVPSMAKEFLLSDELKELFEPGQKFDLIIMDDMFIEVALGFSHLYNAPIIYMSTQGTTYPVISQLFGSPLNPSFEAAFPGFSPSTGFMARVLNALSISAFQLLRYFFVIPMFSSVSEEVFGKDVPSIYELEKNVKLLFLNTHFSLGEPKRLLPNVVEVAGINCRPAKPLPKDLLEFVQGSGENGFIYLSFGSVVRPSDMPEDLLHDLLKLFSELPLRVVWKWDQENIEGLPPNVKIGKWLPQQDILGHPKIRAFITHGGLFSCLETIYHGVPLIGVPFFGDQEFNMNDAVNSGHAIKLPVADLNGENLKKAINEIIANNKYKEAVRRSSRLFRDQETLPLDRAVYWTEYVIRHRGAPHLRSAAAELSWLQYNLIDVYAFIFCVFTLLILTMYYSIRFVCRRVYCRKPNTKVKLN